MWCSAADTQLQLLDHVVSGAIFLTEGVFECDLAHCRSVAVLCMYAAQDQVQPDEMLFFLTYETDR